MSREDLSPERVTPETKVGLFVLIALAAGMLGFLIWGNLYFHPPFKMHIVFQDVDGIDEQSPVKVDGVPVGVVDHVTFTPQGIQLTIVLRKEFPVYQNARARLHSTGIIGTRYVALSPGFPIKGLEGDQRFKNGGTLIGTEAAQLDRAVTRAANTLDQITANGKLVENFHAMMANVHSINAAFREASGPPHTTLAAKIRGFERASGRGRDILKRWDDALGRNEQKIISGIHRFREGLEHFDEALARWQRGEGSFGHWVSDRKAGEDFKQSITQLKATSEAAKLIITKATKVRVFWEATPRQNFKSGSTHFDFGIRLEATPSRFYYVGGSNLGTKSTIQQSQQNYEPENTVTALLGRNLGPVSGALGVIRSQGGVELRYRPFQDIEYPVLNRLEFLGQAFNFGRNSVINGRTFNKPEYIAGVRVGVSRTVSLGAQVEDIVETTDWTGVINIAFEDPDFAKLLGFTSFGHTHLSTGE